MVAVAPCDRVGAATTRRAAVAVLARTDGQCSVKLQEMSAHAAQQMSAHYPDATLRYAYEMTSRADLLLPPVDDMRVDRATPAAAAAECRAADAATAKREIATVPAALDLQRGMDGCSICGETRRYRRNADRVEPALGFYAAVAFTNEEEGDV
jgi:hypothetical protein